MNFDGGQCGLSAWDHIEDTIPYHMVALVHATRGDNLVHTSKRSVQVEAPPSIHNLRIGHVEDRESFACIPSGTPGHIEQRILGH